MITIQLQYSKLNENSFQLFLAPNLYELTYWGVIEPRIGDANDEVYLFPMI